MLFWSIGASFFVVVAVFVHIDKFFRLSESTKTAKKKTAATLRWKAITTAALAAACVEFDEGKCRGSRTLAAST